MAQGLPFLPCLRQPPAGFCTRKQGFLYIDAMNTPTTLPLRAEFNQLIRPYLVIVVGLTIASTIIGLPFALIWFLGVGQWWARHYFAKLECVLSDKTLRYRKGILVQIEKTIPLENIQDVTFIEGPLLRHFHLSTLKFETAGHTAGQANNMQLTGIINAHEYRNYILEAREALRQQTLRGQQLPEASANALVSHNAQTASQLATLQNIEHHLAEIVTLLKERK
jgi:membrane protein YdbS with pleckstrin-like domain